MYEIVFYSIALVLEYLFSNVRLTNYCPQVKNLLLSTYILAATLESYTLLDLACHHHHYLILVETLNT